uniref:WAP domain-containing protein n=1 Tax=Meloidogyne hapla TaxID=6305 RepID=A0A1I8BK96_MELHA
MDKHYKKAVFQNYRKVPRSFSLLILFTLIKINLAILFSPINACDLFLLNRGNTLGCGGFCPPSCGLSLLNLASPFQAGAVPLPPQPPPTILQPQIPTAYTAPRPFPTPFFRAPSLLAPPPSLSNVLSPPILQTAPVVPPPRILQPVSNPQTRVQLIPLAMCAMPCRRKMMSPAMPRNNCCNGDYCDIDCCSDEPSNA